MVVETRPIQHRKAGDVPNSGALSLRELAEHLGVSYSGAREAALRGQLPEGITAFKVGGQWRFSRAAVYRVLDIEEPASSAGV